MKKGAQSALTIAPYLTGAEVDELCKPLTQRSAQLRRLCTMLGINDPAKVLRRPDGLPIIGRHLLEETINGGPAKAGGAINWSK